METVETGIENEELSPMTQLRRTERKRQTACCPCMKSKFCFHLSQRVETFVEDDRFKSFIMVVIVLNTVALMTEYYDQPDYLTLI